MFDRLKQMWWASPWYIKLALLLVGFLALFLPRDFIHQVLDTFDREKTDKAAAQIETREKADDQKIAEDQGKLQELNEEKVQVSKQETDDATDFFNNHKLPNQ